MTTDNFFGYAIKSDGFYKIPKAHINNPDTPIKELEKVYAGGRLATKEAADEFGLFVDSYYEMVFDLPQFNDEGLNEVLILAEEAGGDYDDWRRVYTEQRLDKIRSRVEGPGIQPSKKRVQVQEDYKKYVDKFKDTLAKRFPDAYDIKARFLMDEEGVATIISKFSVDINNITYGCDITETLGSKNNKASFSVFAEGMFEPLASDEFKILSEAIKGIEEALNAVKSVDRAFDKDWFLEAINKVFTGVKVPNSGMLSYWTFEIPIKKGATRFWNIGVKKNTYDYEVGLFDKTLMRNWAPVFKEEIEINESFEKAFEQFVIKAKKVYERENG
jgi:hypothetical protein